MAADTITDPSSPFYIHPSENPALILVAPPLDGTNYHSWARAMKMALLSKNKLKFVDGTISPPPVTDPLFPAWERCNNLVQGWLTKSLSPTIAKSILWFDRASEIWTDLRARYSQTDIFRIADLQEEIYNLKQGHLSVSDYYTHLKILWDELSSIRPLKSCDCGSTAVALHHRDEDYVIRFLKGLNDQFTSVKSQIMLLDPLPPINRVFSLVLQQERELRPPSEPKLLLAATTHRPPNSGFGSGFRQSTSKQCTYCGKPRHTEATCYRKHGFPPGFKFRSSGSSSVVNHVNTQDSGTAQVTHTASVSPTSSTASVLPQLSADQYQRLLTLLSSPQTSTSSVNHLSTAPVTTDSLTPTFADDWFS